MLKRTLLLLSVVSSQIVNAQLASTLNYNPNKFEIKNTTNFTFNYYAQYIGRSLDDRYQNGATYNRFDGGTSKTGKRFDTTGSEQLYQSFKLGYKLPRNMVVSYGVTYQDNLNKNIKYNDGQSERDYGRSFNNHRVSLWVPSILTGNKASLSANFFFERPTYKSTNSFSETDYSDNSTQTTVVDMEYQYGVGIQPTLAIYSNTLGLYHGLTASFERYVFPENTVVIEKDPYWCARNNNCSGISKNKYQFEAQGFKANLGAYMNYVLNDKFTLKSSVSFDWDQVGDQVGTLDKWGNNMDNVGYLGSMLRVQSNLSLEAGVNFSLEEASLERTAIQAALNLTI